MKEQRNHCLAQQEERRGHEHAYQCDDEIAALLDVPAVIEKFKQGCQQDHGQKDDYDRISRKPPHVGLWRVSINELGNLSQPQTRGVRSAVPPGKLQSDSKLRFPGACFVPSLQAARRIPSSSLRYQKGSITLRSCIPNFSKQQISVCQVEGTHLNGSDQVT
jgi:hypothetical protein